MRFALVCALVTAVACGAFLAVLHVAARRYLPEMLHSAEEDVYWNLPAYDRIRRAALSRLLVFGAAGVTVVSLVAAGLGWLLAGWALRPLRRVTESARRVAQSHDLTERIGLDGPREDATELAGIFDGMLARLARSFDGQRRFVANASHELRTPLSINQTLVDVAVRNPAASEDLRRLGESLLLVNARHERLIDGLLTLAEGERTVLDRSPLDLRDVAEHALDRSQEEAGTKDVTVHRLLDGAPTAGNAILLERLVQNLVDNGLRHNRAGGELWVTTRRRDDRIELLVANTGLPVPAYEVQSIFDPFRRLHGDRLGSDRGSGLGLSIVRAIAEAHGGRVAASPRAEGGLTVTVELPAHGD
ncbi:sensor histidine kinase [Actinomadura sp. WAC 06369]|uniref:sensor histidine kinase n=1 Tax=Actinomadura sp. WAC 06369 TaxID=2203193 RepID=UPI0018F31D46|nr:HAMP domain-containing sensor histidine kinase [Actinomadura sp. WAC 06369]